MCMQFIINGCVYYLYTDEYNFLKHMYVVYVYKSFVYI